VNANESGLTKRIDRQILIAEPGRKEKVKRRSMVKVATTSAVLTATCCRPIAGNLRFANNRQAIETAKEIGERERQERCRKRRRGTGRGTQVNDGNLDVFGGFGKVDAAINAKRSSMKVDHDRNSDREEKLVQHSKETTEDP
jgi:hypothetical protein